MYDIAVIGAGITGCSIARELSRYNIKILLIEKNSDVADGTTKANSAIVHAGYDAKPGTLKARFNVPGALMYEKLCSELDVPYKKTGSLVLAFSPEEMKTIQKLYDQGIANGVPDMEIIGKDKVHEIDGNLSDEVVGALYARNAGIVSPWELAIALAENAVENGVELFLDSEVTRIEKMNGLYRLHMGDRFAEARFVINCAGLYSDKVNEMVAAPSFKILPRRGQYNVFDKSLGNFVNTVIFQCPSDSGKGVLISPTIHGNIFIGPDAEDIEDREAVQTTLEGISYIWEASARSAKGLKPNAVITAFAGIRARSSTDDFVIGESKEAKGFINVAGIESPGLTAAPAIAVHVADIVKGLMGGLEVNPGFNPVRRRVVRFMELSEEDKRILIKQDPRYGRIICRCESITEGEIVDAIHRKAGARSLDGVKKRVRPGSGRCQGSFCGPRVMEILARELGIDIKDVVKNNRKSYILAGETKDNSLYEDIHDIAAASRKV
ncbi:MAG TPA: NAD(P)/FAD-dependent oxidoreductase [Bacillota bacterium]|nr:NAD(P)/FAD-dependent oxidoreductase [Bacillota bacterium]HRS21028.1 NAD(P)/FAD-dependent oxidoreductase [Clostridia bacterium]HQE66261.1 NAD(P)/FAD-dependent oxidoreductase [Bacillota bacterium]HQI17285.1 NAD(P)/FAD-dependent oxidoreductase [Bacillota bacterium]HQJ37767.1 NAD(P)/FAD-dependent oxidoreductase [Bacillota bacterium]